MRYLSLLLFAAFISCGSPGSNEKEETKNEGANQDGGTQTVKGVTLTVPEGWEPQRAYEGTDLMVMSPLEIGDQFRENFNVIVTEGAGSLSLSEYSEQSIDYFRSNTSNFELLAEGSDKIDGTDAKWIDYKFDYENRTIYGKQYYALKNGKAYVITYSGTGAANDPHKTTFLNTLKTIKLQ